MFLDNPVGKSLIRWVITYVGLTGGYRELNLVEDDIPHLTVCHSTTTQQWFFFFFLWVIFVWVKFRLGKIFG